MVIDHSASITVGRKCLFFQLCDHEAAIPTQYVVQKDIVVVMQTNAGHGLCSTLEFLEAKNIWTISEMPFHHFDWSTWNTDLKRQHIKKPLLQRISAVANGRFLISFFEGISWCHPSYFTMVEKLPGLEFPALDILLSNSPICIIWVWKYHSSHGSDSTLPTTTNRIFKDI